MEIKRLIWGLLLVLSIDSARSIMDSELHYVASKDSSRFRHPSDDDYRTTNKNYRAYNAFFSPRTNPFQALFLQHFYLKKCSTFSSPLDNRFFYDKSLDISQHLSRGGGGAQTHLRDILLVSPPPSCEEPLRVNKEPKELPPKAVQIGMPSSEDNQGVVDKKEEEIIQPEEESLLNSTEIQIPPKVENKTEDIPSFREWTQKALEKEEKERKEVQDKKKQQQQNQIPSSEQNSTNQSAPSSSSLPESKNGSVHVDSGSISASNGVGNGVNNGGGGSGGSSLPVSTAGSKSPVLGSSPGNRLKKNYGSVDCGAKIVGSNPESTGGNYIISSHRDEYMLNKCSDKIWFVIELCESIKARRIEIANFELYSSVPQEFRVSLSNVYPSRDWTLFGMFRAVDSREVQVFDSSEDNVFGKYVKVEILSHHGSEHYCPISLFKIFGISEIELMAQDDEDEDPQDEPEEEEHHPSAVKTRGKSSIVNFIKEKVDETIGRVVKVVFRGSASSQSESEPAPYDSPMQTPVYTLNCPHCNGTQFQEVSGLMSTELSLLENILENHHMIRPLLKAFACESFGFPSGRKNSNSTSSIRSSSLYDLYKCVYGSSRIIALCNIAYHDANSLAKAPNSSSSSGSIHSEEEGSRIEGNSSSCDTPAAAAATTASPTEKKEQQKGAPSPTKPLPDDLKDSEAIRPSRVESEEGNDGGESKSSSPQISVEPSAVVPKSMLDPPSVVHVPPPASSMVEDQEPKSSSGSNSGSNANQRESVWQKLTNRIKSLERNVSFSSSYLEELSVQYKKQIEDLTLSVRQSAESLNSAMKSVLMERNERKKLEAQVRELSSSVFILSEKIDSISLWTFGAHVAFIILEILVGCYCVVSTNKQISGRIREYHSSLQSSSPKNCKRRIVDEDKENMQISPVVEHKQHSREEEEEEKTTSRSPTPCRRSLSLEEDEERSLLLSANLKPRRSLDFTSLKSDTEQHQQQYPLNLTRRQRRRIQQTQRRKISASSKLKHMRTEASPPKIRVQNLFSCILPPIETHNMFSSLNSSVHGDPTPIKALSIDYESNNNNNESSHPKGKLTTTSSQSASVASNSKSLVRSKSTSPTRKSEAAKQREDFENFDPQEFRSSHSPLPPSI